MNVPRTKANIVFMTTFLKPAERAATAITNDLRNKPEADHRETSVKKLLR